MKSYLLLLSLAVLVLVSCKDDEPEIDPIVGVWIVEEFAVTDATAGYSNVEGTFTSFLGEARYTLTINSDMTYQRELLLTGPDIEEEGEWEIEDDEELYLDPDGSEDQNLFYEFKIDEKVTGDELNLSVEAQTRGLPDILLDTIDVADYTDAELDSISNKYVTLVDVVLRYYFEKE